MNNFSTLAFDDTWSFANKKHEIYSHNYHRYPAKFTSPLANKLISSESQEGDLVCDTFGGCGTTLLEAKLLGRQSIGFDINPVAKFITEVKSKAIQPKKINKAYVRLNESIDSCKNLENDYFSTHERIQYWFSEQSYLSLNMIYYSIVEEENHNIQKFFLCAFSHCLKNCSRWLMKSIKPTVDKNKMEVDVIKVFQRHTERMIKKNILLYEYLKNSNRLNLKSKIELRDITKLNTDLSVDLIVTSPPYVTSYEYGDLHQLTILWFGQKKYRKWQRFLKNHQDFKSQFIGSSIQPLTISPQSSHLAGKIVNDLLQKDIGLAKKVNNYFTKMEQSFRVMHRLLKKNKKLCVVIGNTKMKDVSILNAEISCEQLVNMGFTQDQVIKRNANTNKMVAPYRDKTTGKFTSIASSNKMVAYHEEYILKFIK